MGVIAEMSFLLFGLLLFHLLSNCVNAKQSELEEDAGGDLEEAMYKSQKLNGHDIKVEELLQRVERMEILEAKLESQSLEMESLKKQLDQMHVQLASDLTKQVKENENQCKAEVKSEVEKVEQRLRDLPFEMVCAFQDVWSSANSIVSYDQISLEFNNSDRPGGADGSMNIETGVFTTVTSGYYIVTFGGTVYVHSGEFTVMYLYHNGVQLEESEFHTRMQVGSGDDYITDQGSRTVILHLLAGDTLDLRT